MDEKSKTERVILAKVCFYENLIVKEIMFVQIWFLFFLYIGTLFAIKRENLFMFCALQKNVKDTIIYQNLSADMEFIIKHIGGVEIFLMQTNTFKVLV